MRREGRRPWVLGVGLLALVVVLSTLGVQPTIDPAGDGGHESAALLADGGANLLAAPAVGGSSWSVRDLTSLLGWSGLGLVGLGSIVAASVAAVAASTWWRRPRRRDRVGRSLRRASAAPLRAPPALAPA
jgi:hypothetical protein